MSESNTNEEQGDFSAQFLRDLDDIEERAKNVGLTITHVCREAGVSRATPDRWRENVPNTISLMDKMLSVVKRAEVARAAEQKQ